MAFHNLHDKTFRELFSEKEQARDLIRLSLPAEINAILDLETLASEPDSFIDDSLRDVQSDLLFSVQTKSGSHLKIYTLFEHKSYQDPKIHIQLLSYLTRIYTKMEKLTLVIPLVFYHGEKGWEVPIAFAETLALTTEEKRLLQSYLPDFSYALLDLSRTDINGLLMSLTSKAILYPKEIGFPHGNAEGTNSIRITTPESGFTTFFAVYIHSRIYGIWKNGLKS